MKDESNLELDRRAFFRGVIGGLGGIALVPGFANNEPTENELTILHTNDVHSHLDAFPDNHPRYPGMGGSEARAALVAELRNQDPDLLLLDAGDMFQGTPYYNFFLGEPEIKIMNLLGYDAGTIGNHEFDNGPANLASLIKKARFPLLNCNYGLDGSELGGLVSPYRIFYRKGIRVGIFGLGINLDGLVSKKLTVGIKYYDAMAAAQNTSAFLKNRKRCDLVICLSHLGFQYSGNQISDLVLARGSEHIDIIIGGHSHTFLDEAVFETNSVGEKVLISQAGWAGLRLGKISVKFNIKDKYKKGFSGTVIDFKKSSAK